MSIFYLIFILLAIYFSWNYDGIEEYDSRKQHRLWLMCGYLICLSGFSYKLGADKFMYLDEFELYPNSFSEASDYIWINFMLRGQMPLWTLLNLFCKINFDSFYVVQFIESTVVNITICYLASQYTRRYFLFLLVYFISLQYFIFNTEVMREGFALSLGLLAIHEYLNGKKWLLAILLPIAFLFHVSVAIVLLFPFLNFTISWKTIIYATIAAILIWGFGDKLLSSIIIKALGGQGAFAQKILYYSMQTSNIFGFTRALITYLILPFIVMYTNLTTEESPEQKKKKEKLISFMLILAVMASSFAGAGFIRFYNYIRLFYLVMLTDFIYTLLLTKKHLLLRIGTLAATVFLIILSYFAHYESTNSYFYEFFYPYTCILDENVDVQFREIAHQEAVTLEERDDNVRSIE